MKGNNMEPTINLELSVAEVNTILASLGKHPFVEIANLIGKIKEQGEAQIAATQQAESEPESPNE